MAVTSLALFLTLYMSIFVRVSSPFQFQSDSVHEAGHSCHKLVLTAASIHVFPHKKASLWAKKYLNEQ